MSASTPSADPPFEPYVPADSHPTEFTAQSVIVGALLGILFGASSLYLVLKVGMTVSASIPVAVLAITLFRLFTKTTVLENNTVQTTGSAGESIAFGVGVTMPALLLIGQEITFLRVMVVSVLGGVLGILMMIPLRRAFIVKLHGKPGQPGTLLYPEGTACAQVLISGDKGGSGGLLILVGFLIAFGHKFITEGLMLLRATVEVPIRLLGNGVKASGEMASELLGVGYIIGFRTSAIMMAGAVLGSLVLVPSMLLGGNDISQAKDNLKFIGAGCVAAAGIISMFRTLPMIVRSFSAGVTSMRGGAGAAGPKRTEDDLSMRFVLFGCLMLLLAFTMLLISELGFGQLPGAILGSLLVLVFGFLFVTVSSRLTGEIGSSSNPISGMTVAALLMTCLIFLALGMTNSTDAVLALSIGGVVCIAASNGGTTSQALKTGFLLGATPKWQQWAIIIGTVSSALVIGLILLMFNSAGIVYTQRDLPTINVKEKLDAMPAKETYQDEEFFVWQVREKMEGVPSDVKPGKYLVDKAGQVVYRVDPTITGRVPVRDTVVSRRDGLPPLDLKADLDKVKTTFTVRTPAAGGQPGPVTHHKLWQNPKPDDLAGVEEKDRPVYRADFPSGLYLVNADGQVVNEVETSEVRLKFPAPKTEVMGIIINGLLNANLKWTLILIGAFIAVTLELCGVSSLAFAVGLYVPMQYSVPIFLGGLVRSGVDGWNARRDQAEMAAAKTEAERAEAEVRAIARSETSPGVLLASGLIAGGSLAGVMLAFFQMYPDLPKWLDTKVAETMPTPAAEIAALVGLAVLIGVLALTALGWLFKEPERK